MNNLSIHEENFCSFVRNTGCINKWQAMHILTKYYRLSDGRANHIIRNLLLHSYIKAINEEETLFVVGGLYGKEHFDRSVVEAISICMCLMDADYDLQDDLKYKSLLNDIKYARKPANEFDLSFISSGRPYQVMHVRPDEMFKVNVVEQRQKEEITRIQRLAKATGFTGPTTIFSFSHGIDQDFILDKFETMGLTIPHRICFLRSSHIEDYIPVDIYGE